jgi:hypothetical protein
MRTLDPYILGIFALASIILLPEAAYAYVGPGAGVSVLGALWGLIVGIVLAIGVIVFWPVKLMIRKLKAKNAPTGQIPAEQTNGTTPHDGNPSQRPPAA